MDLSLISQILVWGGWFMFAVTDLFDTLKKSLKPPGNQRAKRALEINIALSIPINLLILILSTVSLLTIHA